MLTGQMLTLSFLGSPLVPSFLVDEPSGKRTTSRTSTTVTCASTRRLRGRSTSTPETSNPALSGGLRWIEESLAFIYLLGPHNRKHEKPSFWLLSLASDSENTSSRQSISCRNESSRHKTSNTMVRSLLSINFLLNQLNHHPSQLQSALFHFQSLLLVILLLICTCAYIKSQFPSLIDKNKTGWVL